MVKKYRVQTQQKRAFDKAVEDAKRMNSYKNITPLDIDAPEARITGTVGLASIPEPTNEQLLDAEMFFRELFIG